MAGSGLRDTSTLADWLAWLEKAHTKEIDLGLKRVTSVFKGLDCHRVKRPFTITVAGTNGKGSSVALLESILISAGYRVGSYTTPHLLIYNERIKINAQPVTDSLICSSFAHIDQKRAGTSLSYFEFGTLAALDIFDQQKVDVQILEVGLGGRLDAVNIIDADAALITTIGIDHTDWLGTDIAQIAREKAGIFRADQLAVCSAADVPKSLVACADELGTKLSLAGVDFNCKLTNKHWQLEADHIFAGQYLRPVSAGDHQIRNAAGVVTLLAALNDKLAVSKGDIAQGLATAQVLGRHQVIAGKPTVILDVAHNAQSAQAFADFVIAQECMGSIHAVFSILADKQMSQVLQPFLKIVSSWSIAPLNTPRAEQVSVINLALLGQQQVREFDSVKSALSDVKKNAAAADLIICFGSFFLVEECLREL